MTTYKMNIGLPEGPLAIAANFADASSPIEAVVDGERIPTQWSVGVLRHDKRAAFALVAQMLYGFDAEMQADILAAEINEA